MFIYEMTKTTDWTDDGPKTKYHFIFDFEGKEQYLEQRDGWRKEYKELSKRIRQHKLWRKPSLRPEEWNNSYGWKNLSMLMNLQEQARMMMQMRTQSKEEANRQMVAQRQAA